MLARLSRLASPFQSYLLCRVPSSSLLDCGSHTVIAIYALFIQDSFRGSPVLDPDEITLSKLIGTSFLLLSLFSRHDLLVRFVRLLNL